ncbi:hypothetical protein DPEC_G00031420 [Dallia pectoralis]|uniref:Uncharacterized protein n=1 Tax=Dallia pectoralis TaxID=75939 RepID=A0ACC2HCL0_DALPE|nr:hypothetical protein DPEC_G00031420 [Dallia pectoralis]
MFLRVNVIFTRSFSQDTTGASQSRSATRRKPFHSASLPHHLRGPPLISDSPRPGTKARLTLAALSLIRYRREDDVHGGAGVGGGVGGGQS